MAKKKPEPPKAAAQSWNDGLEAALPRRAQYYAAMRTGAFTVVNNLSNYVEFRAALQVDKAGDKWHVVQYELHDAPGGLVDIRVETVLKKDNEDGGDGKKREVREVSFAEAAWHLAAFETQALNLPSYGVFDVSSRQYGEGAQIFLQNHFHALEHYKTAAHVEGIVFDSAGHPHRRVEGKVISFEKTTFSEAELLAAARAGVPADASAAMRIKMEAGILSDLFNDAAAAGANSLDDALKTSRVLAQMDEFAAHIGAFYLSVQKKTGADDKYDLIDGLTPEEKKSVHAAARACMNLCGNGDYDAIRDNAAACLDMAEKEGAHTEPFRKFLSECGVYWHLLCGRIEMLEQMKNAAVPGKIKPADITRVKQLSDTALKEFLALGGTEDRYSLIQGHIMAEGPGKIVQSLPGFLTRYYKARGNIMSQMKERRARFADARVMSVQVKPPAV